MENFQKAKDTEEMRRINRRKTRRFQHDKKIRRKQYNCVST